MFFINRAIKYLKRKIGKTALLVVIFLVIANFVLAGLLVQNAAETAQDNTRQSIGADISYITNYSTLMDDVRTGILDRSLVQNQKNSTGGGLLISEDIGLGGGPTLENFNSVIASDYVKSVSYSVALNVTADAISYQSDSTVETSSEFTIQAYGAQEPEDLLDGNVALIEGRFANDQEIANGTPVIIIEDALAEINHLGLNDTLDIFYTIDGETVEITHEIIGIYDNLRELSDTSTAFGGASLQYENQIYTPFNIVNSLGYSSDDIQNIVLTNTVIRLNDPEDLEAYRQEAESKIILNYGALDANDDLYESLVGPIESLGLISSILVTIIVVTGGLIIGLITALTVNERKGEIGILLAVGESKLKIVSQFVLEVVLIAVIAFSLSMFTGQFLGENISQSLLDSDLISTEDTSSDFGSRRMSLSQDVDRESAENAANIDISIAPIVLIQMFGLGLTLTIVSTIVPSLYVMRFNPKQILISRAS